MKLDCIKYIFAFLFVNQIVFTSNTYAAFPDDLSDVVFVHNDISSWPVTSTLSVSVSSNTISMPYDKAKVWPSVNHQFCSGCNANPWIIVNFDGTWYAGTFEWFRFGQTAKPLYVVHGDHIKRSPFGTTWTPKNGETYGFMVSGFARFNDNVFSAKERTNIVLYKWGQGMVDSLDQQPNPPEPPVTPSDTHVYQGKASGVLSGELNGDNVNFPLEESVVITVNNNREMTMKIDDESFTTKLSASNSFKTDLVLPLFPGCTSNAVVTGRIIKKKAVGTIVGGVNCSGNPVLGNADLRLNGTFEATSLTEPSFVKPPSITPILNLLLE